MKKTFYSVNYAVWGADNLRTIWFDDLTDAKRFANHDYRDGVVTHTYSNPGKIADAERLVRICKGEATLEDWTA